MRPEDLFLAIGSVEDSRLARSEMSVSSREKQEDKTMRVRPRRIIRNVMAAAILVSMLAVTAYAVTGFLIFDSPEEMITAIFGDQTGFDHSEGSVQPDPWGGPEGILVEPTFDRMPADETVIAEDIAPYVDVVGQSVSANGYTVTVDAFLYDSTTKCGILTYLLENPNGLPKHQLQSNGEIWFEGMPNPVDINLYGYPYIIQEKTTPNCLAAVYYFMDDGHWGDTLEIGLDENIRYTPEDREKLLTQAEKRIRETMTEEDILARLEENLGRELLDQILQEQGKEALIESCYQDLAAAEMSNQMDAGEKIRISLDDFAPMDHVTAGDGSIIVTPISLWMDIRPHKFLHIDKTGSEWISTDNVDSIVIRYDDGSDYIVEDGYIINTMFAIGYYPEGTTQTEHIVSPEEDPMGEGYSYMETSQPRCLLTRLFNRIIDVDKISAVIINGTELALD